MFLGESQKMHAFSPPLTANENSSQPSATPKNFDPAVNRKPYI